MNIRLAPIAAENCERLRQSLPLNAFSKFPPLMSITWIMMCSRSRSSIRYPSIAVVHSRLLSGFATQPFEFVTNRLDSIETIANLDRIQSSSLADQHKAAIT